VRRLLPFLVALLALPAGARAADVAQYVDPMIGTLGAGFVFPGADAPFGMVQNSPDTFTPGAGYSGLVYSGYMGNDPQIRDFSLVHLSGPGVAKGGDLPFMPWVAAGGQTPPSDPTQYATPYSHATESAGAGYYTVTLANGIKAELTASEHAAMQRYAFPPAADAYLIVDPWHNNDGDAASASFKKTAPRELTGETFQSHYHVYFVAQFDQDIADTGPHWVKFAPGQTVTMRVGISFVDLDGARENLDAEAPPRVTFEAMRAQTFAAWNAELGKVGLTGGTDPDLKTFYTALYHATQHPNVFSDVDGRYRGFDDKIRNSGAHPQYANFSSWDTYKAQNQLLALLWPGRYADMLRSELRDAQQGGHLPRWAEQNYDPAHMSGDPAIPMIADGACRGLLGDDLAEELYQQAVALRGRRDANLDKLGFLPLNPGTTLEYGVADFALALLAERLGHHDDAQRWLNASLNYRNTFDPGTQWVRPRNADGTWSNGDPGDFDPTVAWDPALSNQGFQEGNSWQYSWLVPHDPRGLFGLMGGDAAVVSRLDQFFAAPAEVQNRVTGFGTVYKVGQFAPGNEHDLGAPFMYPFAKQPWKTQAEMRTVQSEYRPIAEGLPGNDDLGSLSAYYVFSALGFSPFTPGAPLYMVGAPIFTQAKLALPGGPFTLDAPGASVAGKYVQSATLNGAPLNKAWFGESAIRGGGTLHLEMGPVANQSWAADNVPPSASDAPLSAFGCQP
jgi:putative alpha-1,2-mannosidase